MHTKLSSWYLHSCIYLGGNEICTDGIMKIYFKMAMMRKMVLWDEIQFPLYFPKKPSKIYTQILWIWIFWNWCGGEGVKSSGLRQGNYIVLRSSIKRGVDDRTMIVGSNAKREYCFSIAQNFHSATTFGRVAIIGWLFV